MNSQVRVKRKEKYFELLYRALERFSFRNKYCCGLRRLISAMKKGRRRIALDKNEKEKKKM